ncbi:tetratricopeptide repeat protein [Desulfocastanea catecholica]
MKRLLACILLFFTGLPCAADASELIKVSRRDRKDIVQFYFSFDVPPEFTSIRSERRIDLEFFKTTSAPSVSLGSPDKDIVKILPRPTEDKFILSLFFRYRPQGHKLTRSSDGKVVFEVLLGNEYSTSYQDLADRLKGLTVLETAPLDGLNPYLQSPYAKDWISFFSRYESPVTIDIPVKFSYPPFPLISLLPPGGEANLQFLTAEMVDLARLNLWHDLAGKLLRSIQNSQDVEAKKLLALTYGEVLSRNGNFADAYKQLSLLKEQYSDELLGTYAKYLLIHLGSAHQDPYLAESNYKLLESSISNSLPLAPYFLLSQIETALATANYARLNHLLLREDVAFPQQVAEIVHIRQADYWYAIHQPIKAKAAYQLQAGSQVLQTMPYSLAGSCHMYYDLQQFAEAATCYNTLSTLVSDEPLLGLIDYRKIMSQLNTGEQTSLIDELCRIEKNFPGTEAGYRAALKKNDLLFLQDPTWGLEAIAHYAAIAQKADSRPLREEALFKQALVHALVDEKPKSVQLLQQYLREFLTGDVRISAQALLIDLLPGEIKRLVDTQEYIQALVLAKQNKNFFQNKWIDNTYLVDIAEAYNRIGIYDEAQKLYLYLIEIMPVDQREDLFLPMIRATFAHGNYSLVDDYAAQYTYTYPDGRYTDEVLFFRLQSLVADERLGDALQLLPEPLPENVAVYELATALFFRTDNYEKCLAVAKKLADIKNPLSQKEQYMLAESLCRTGLFAEAEQAFMAISKDSDFYQQSLYRLAELARREKNEKKALSLFEKLVETEENSPWKQYAERELQFVRQAARL